MFLNGILFNAEILYVLTKAEVSEFEDLDRLLLRKLLQAQISTPEGILLPGVRVNPYRRDY